MTTLNGLRIVLADDHTIVRMGFRLLIEGAGGTVVEEANSGETALSAYAEHTPEVLVMDVSMPGMGGLAALERLLARHRGARVLMLSAHEDTQIPARALQAGATGYLSKRAHPNELLKAIAAVSRGEHFIDSELAPRLAMACMGGNSNPASSLTAREFNVFVQLAHGRSVADVAATLKLSNSTVGTHLYHIKQKLNADNAAELALIAVRAGLVEA
ncbi:response regulator transcription factor [Azoarcus sp. L1K30]|uniref:response regulator n=1 Tax=Azoarcus sp. L1K30 TaxID=2820277 RepID=UPI001B842BF9|nr:response regulator transcription factor [Azoarcus sp. L1K30]MBR0568752.1 response regulator transcription factor [Azoarcus sp. L1K30]